MDRCLNAGPAIAPKMEATSPVAEKKIPQFVVKMAQKVAYIEDINT